MKEEIIKELRRIEEESSIKILYAVESGSRAWGFPSTDSDWDVRFIYIHHLDWYLNIEDKKDNYEKILPNDIDLSGWELKKALKLFRKSNPPLLEWLRSPIIYQESLSTAEQLRQLSDFYFNPRSCLHHYLHMAEGNYQAYLMKDVVRLKKYFYVLRPILACDWIRKNNTMAPMEFNVLVESLVNDLELKGEIERLLERKMNGEELSEAPRIPIIQDFLEEKISYYNDYIKGSAKIVHPDTDALNMLFRQTMDDAWGLSISSLPTDH